MTDAYENMREMFQRKADQAVTLHGLIGRWQGLADHAQMAMTRGDSEWLMGVLAEMAQHSEQCEKEMQSWRT